MGRGSPESCVVDVPVPCKVVSKNRVHVCIILRATFKAEMSMMVHVLILNRDNESLPFYLRMQ